MITPEPLINLIFSLIITFFKLFYKISILNSVLAFLENQLFIFPEFCNFRTPKNNSTPEKNRSGIIYSNIILQIYIFILSFILFKAIAVHFFPSLTIIKYMENYLPEQLLSYDIFFLKINSPSSTSTRTVSPSSTLLSSILSERLFSISR